MGSSMVMMCSLRVSLISSIMAASVVDLPEPVGPVTSTKPRGLAVSWCSDLRQAELVKLLDLTGMSRKAAPTLLRWKKAFTRKRAWPGTEYERSISQSVSSRCRWSWVRML